MENVKLDNVPCVVWVHEAEESAVLPVKASGEPGDESQPCTVIPLGLQNFSSTRSVRRDAPAVVRDTLANACVELSLGLALSE